MSLVTFLTAPHPPPPRTGQSFALDLDLTKGGVFFPRRRDQALPGSPVCA